MKARKLFKQRQVEIRKKRKKKTLENAGIYIYI